MRYFLVLSLMLLPGLAAAAPATYGELQERARAALARDDYVAAVAALDSAQSLRPYSLWTTRQRIAALAADGRVADAVAVAAAVAARGIVIDLSGAAFANLHGDPRFAALQARFAQNLEPRGNSRVEWTLADRDLLPEALAHADGTWAVGSARTGRIVWLLGPHRAVQRLPGGIFDLEIRGNTLFAAVNDQPPYWHARQGQSRASLLAVDLASGAVRHAVYANPDSLFGDLEVDRDGSLYASDSRTPRVVVLKPGASAVTDLARDPRFVNLQGLALDAERGLLFVADYLTGVFAIETRTGAVRQLANPSDAHLGGIDGLYLYRGDLVGIQNGVSPQRLVRLRLDRSAATIEHLEVLAQGLPQWNEPTHGVIAGDRLFYIATSNWPAYDDDGQVRDVGALKPLRIMSVALD